MVLLTMPKMSKDITASLLTPTGILIFGFLMSGIFIGAEPPLSYTIQDDNSYGSETRAAIYISKETLLLLLAVGIAGALGIQRKKKNIKSPAPPSRSIQHSDP